MADRRPLHGKCRGCGYVWVVVYLPMELVKAAEAMKRTACPRCRGRKVFVANERDVMEAGLAR